MSVSGEKIAVLFEDKDLWILDKPSGVHSVSINGSSESFAHLLVDHYSFLTSVAERPGDAGLISRLDFDTSGLIIGAKTRAVWLALREQIQAGRIKKSYLALLEGELREDVSINNYIGSPYRRSKKVRVYSAYEKRSLPATTTLQLLQFIRPKRASLVEALAPTARRHQIRVHAATLGHALIGDSLYGSNRSLRDFSLGKRQFYLHAYRCEFTHPTTGALVKIECPSAFDAVS